MKKPTSTANLALISFGLAILFLTAAIWTFAFDINLKPSPRLIALTNRLNPTPTPAPEPTIENLSAQVIPNSGYTVNLNWGEVGKKLVETGAIDLQKYQDNYSGEQYQQLLTYLTDSKTGGITINSENAYFWVNTLWALGLVQQSQVLDAGVMGTEYKNDIGSFASTGGWTLGAKPAVELYSSATIIPLTDEQQQLVDKIAQGIYRPCCDNPTSFPDCNHGMAILGLIELMVSQGFSETEIYRAALAFNSYWFSQTYIDLAYYFLTQENTSWDKVDPQRVLGQQFSSATGYRSIKETIGTIPGQPLQGAGCGA